MYVDSQPCVEYMLMMLILQGEMLPIGGLPNQSQSKLPSWEEESDSKDMVEGLGMGGSEVGLTTREEGDHRM
jgi:hypothetical protein